MATLDAEVRVSVRAWASMRRRYTTRGMRESILEKPIDKAVAG